MNAFPKQIKSYQGNDNTKATQNALQKTRVKN
jgi:hypothetical protein